MEVDEEEVLISSKRLKEMTDEDSIQSVSAGEDDNADKELSGSDYTRFKDKSSI